MTPRDLFAREALGLIPKILTLQDRNPHSPSYGCFDRNWWHYKIIDFPSGMAQEFVWPLALACETEIPANRFYQQPSIRDWVEAGIRFAARSAHADGSCDDYFPYERAAGATAFSLVACMESYQLLGLRIPELLDFFARRASWLARSEESGRLSNHQALIVLCLAVAGRLTGAAEWDAARDRRLERLLEWQSPEGWFPEYEGFDPGYQTLTISSLARVHEMLPEHDRLRAALSRAVECTAHFVHPDGSFAGEYGSRNTYNYFPHGFELAGRWMPAALSVNDRFLKGLAEGRAPCYADDHILGHHAWNYLLAWRDFATQRPPLSPPPPGRVHLREAGLLVDRRERTSLYVALGKGGTFKCFVGDKLVASDTQVSLHVRRGGRLRCAVAHLAGDYDIEAGEERISISGAFGWAKQTSMSTWKLLVLRLGMLLFGRFFPNLTRRLLQRLLITGKSEAPFRFARSLEWSNGHWTVRDEVHAPRWSEIESAGIGSDQTSIYVVMSRTFQAGQLQRWLDLTPHIRKLRDGEPLILERSLAGDHPLT